MFRFIKTFRLNRQIDRMMQQASIIRDEAFVWEGTEREHETDALVRELSTREVAAMLVAGFKL